MGRIGSTALIVSVLGATAVLATGAPVFETDFEAGIPAEFSSTAAGSDADVGAYHGLFTLSESTTLTLPALPAHSQVLLEFDLYLFNTWDGNNTGFGPDFFSLSGDVTGSWTFTNHQPEGQTYPGSPDEIYGSGASATHVYRGLDPTGTGDGFLVSHSSDTFAVTFAGPTDQTDEQWGIDNVRVTLIPEPSSTMLLGLLTLAGTRLGRRTRQ